MTATSSVPSIVFGPTGPVLPNETDVLAGVLADTNAAFGGKLNIESLETPQGQLASSTAAIIGDKNDQIALLVSQIDPPTSSGRFQDAIGRIYLLDRIAAKPTVLQVACVGAVGTVIPSGWPLCADPAGRIYLTTATTTIPSGGSINVTVENQVFGAISVPTSIAGYKAINGLDTVTLVVGSGVIGSNVESPSEFEYRRQQSVAINATGSLPAIYANVLAIPGVVDAYVTENTTSTTQTVGATSYSLIAHSIYVAAVGGVAADIAKAIWIRKNCGADYNGNTSVSVMDDVGYSPPYPTYTVKFEVPTPTPIKFAVQLSNNASLPSNIVQLVRAAIVSAFSGGDGGPRARIASSIFASRFYSPISATSPYAQILSVKLGTSTPTLDVVTMGIDQVPTIISTDISVTLV